MEKNKCYVILHGHFYQPPREDPWTYEIERQTSAYPDHDWNERINKQCYAANAASRVLDHRGRIEAIINNYAHISFNFGPTLISWLKRKDPYTFRRIVEADKESARINNGHGNAIAQVYNHIIMPLASDEDVITQITWGLESFKRDFGRDAEGIWLAETAINDRIAEFLIRFGIKFIILSPTQAKEVKGFHDHDWKDVSDNSIDPSKPYLLKEQNGELSVFFYYGEFATKLSFQHLLRSVDNIRGEILSSNRKDKPVHLVHTATDGETYGHHEPFGDMCLSRLIYENQTKKDFEFTNYARFLEIQAPVDLVRLKEGNDGLGTAWSCAHGVDRWRRDCGCHTGGLEGWNQKWREYYRNALDILRDTIYKYVIPEAEKYLHDAWKARNEYISVILASDRAERQKELQLFFERFARVELSEDDKAYLLRIMEILHNELLMYTSCAWFFSEISGIETVQNLKYAGRIFDLASDILPSDTRERFLDTLYKAKSNVSENQNGKWIFENFVEKHAFTEEYVLNEFVLTHILTRSAVEPDKVYPYYFYEITMEHLQEMHKDDWVIYKSTLSMNNLLIADFAKYVTYIFKNGNNLKVFIKKYIDDSLMSYLDKIIEKDNPHMMVKDFNSWFNHSYSLSDMKYDAKEKVLLKIFENKMATLHKKVGHADIDIDEYLEVISLYQELGVFIPEKDVNAIKELLNTTIISELETLETVDVAHYDFSKLVKIIQTARRANLQIDYEDILPIIRNYVLVRLNRGIHALDNVELKRIERLIDFSNLAGIDFEKYEIQNMLYEFLSDLTHNKCGAECTAETIKLVLSVASKFNITVLRFEKMLKDRLSQ